ncbi:divalent metal cation transporter [Kineosporia sp. J2-2]|uniref:Divalent metal cation transporter n=1 Tax=Kineosporia corallincola TaxID=2835133 RepID=A0ABS5TR37_9ACTN|nr:NRAMP family divalent metal transporter [Kineosporia corallincola]MBT0772599.1 divalent metal cation transporter [Kineosporia corallincola]
MSAATTSQEARAAGVSRNRLIAYAGAILLMAMSAVGPGFITQTAKFTGTYAASFGAAILASILIDLAIQLNVWRVVGLSGRPAQDIANQVLPGSGHVLTFLIVLGGLIFGIGNIAGAGLGLHDLLGIDTRLGAVISAVIAIFVFSYQAMDGAVDRAVIVLGVVKIGLITFIAIKAAPPVGEALARTVDPQGLDFLPVLTLVGGTVGGYITYAGAHRLLETGTVGREHLATISRGATTGILVTGAVRILLFLGILGVVAGGFALADDDPAGSAFRQVAGESGVRLFGLALWTAGMTSTIGASFTSATFLKTLVPVVARRFSLTISLLITVATIAYLVIGQTPTSLLIFAGAFNGLVLPVGLGLLLWAGWRRPDLLPGYRYPRVLLLIGFAAWAFTVYAGWKSLAELPKIFT